MSPLAKLLSARYGIHDALLRRASHGRTNQTWFVENKPLVVRVGRVDKSEHDALREEHVMGTLHAHGFPVARIVPNLDGHAREVLMLADGAHLIHVFERLHGAPLPMPMRITRGQIEAAVGALARLHKTLEGAACPARDPAAFLSDRRSRVEDRADSTPAVIASDLERFLERADEILAHADAHFAAQPTQWLHGDFHLSNCLFDGERVSGIVDFDDDGCGAPGVELVLALFAVSREPSVDGRFRFDRSAWDLGHAAAIANGAAALDPSALRLYERLYCLHQSLLHVEASQREIWSLDPQSGFWPCWRAIIS